MRPSSSGNAGHDAKRMDRASSGSGRSTSKYWIIGPLPAVYGYTSSVTSAPAALAASILASDSATRPQFRAPAALWWEICTGVPAAAPIASASSTASSRRSASLRMWVA